MLVEFSKVKEWKVGAEKLIDFQENAISNSEAAIAQSHQRIMALEAELSGSLKERNELQENMALQELMITSLNKDIVTLTDDVRERELRLEKLLSWRVVRLVKRLSSEKVE